MTLSRAPVEPRSELGPELRVEPPTPGRRMLADDAEFLRRLAMSRSWQRRAITWLVLADALVLAVTVLTVYLGRFDALVIDLSDEGALVAGLCLVALWLGSLAGFGAYEPRLLAVGTEEFRRIVSASFTLFGGLAIASYVLKLALPRSLVALALPTGVLLLVAERFGVRKWLQARRRQGSLAHRTLIVGDLVAATRLSRDLRRDTNAGFHVVGCVAPRAGAKPTPGAPPRLGELEEALEVAREQVVDTIAVTSSPSVSQGFLRQLSWSLEGSGVDLLVAPAVTNVAGPRISVRPVAGVPLMYVDEPTLSGWTRVFKRAVDVAVSAAGLVLLAPLMFVIGLVVRTTSKGPALFRQERIGRDGESFTILKFRSMMVGADAQLAPLLREQGTDDQPLFKVSTDPRVTPVGKLLRRLSLDELPQLLNVLRGDMSLVGPRPQRPEEVQLYRDLEPLRLAVRPGVTGLWQVSGRSDLPWDEAVRLDLYYVENWSLSMDFTILMRTVLAVWRGEGAC